MRGIKRSSDNKQSRIYINCKEIINGANIESAIVTSLRLYHHQAQKFIEESASPFTFPQLKYLICAKL